MPIPKALLALGSLLLVTAAWADAALYRDGELHIPAGVMVDDSGMHYYQDIRFVADADGRLSLAAFESRPLARVKYARLSLDDNALILELNGTLPTPCHDLEPPAVALPPAGGEEILVALALAPGAGDGVACIQVLSPFQSTFELATEPLPAGDYRVNVNDRLELRFSLSYEDGEQPEISLEQAEASTVD